MATNYAFLPAFIDLFYQKIGKPEVEKKNLSTFRRSIRDKSLLFIIFKT